MYQAASELFRLPGPNLSLQLTDPVLPELCSGKLPEASLEAIAFIETARESPMLLNALLAVPNPGERATEERELIVPDGVKPLDADPTSAPG